jgi:hypothetical protein
MSAIKNDYFGEITSDLEAFDIARADAAWHDSIHTFINAKRKRVDMLAALDAYATPVEFGGYLRLTLIKLLLEDAGYAKIDLAAKNYLREIKP